MPDAAHDEPDDAQPVPGSVAEHDAPDDGRLALDSVAGHDEPDGARDAPEPGSAAGHAELDGAPPELEHSRRLAGDDRSSRDRGGGGDDGRRYGEAFHVGRYRTNRHA